MRSPRTFRPGRRRRAFTLVEVLATLALAAIVLPSVVHGVLLCMATAEHARDQAQAASLAQSKLAELIAEGDIQDAQMSGDFGDDFPRFAWTAEVNQWQDSHLAEVDVAVTWTSRGQQRQVDLSTLVYTGGSQ